MIDTHPLVWWLLAPDRLSKRAADLLHRHDIRIHVPCMVILEVCYLIEIGRIEANIQDILSYVNETDTFVLLPYDAHVLAATIAIDDTRDPFDRIIAGCAVAYGWPLLTRDRWMHKHLKKLAVW